MELERHRHRETPIQTYDFCPTDISNGQKLDKQRFVLDVDRIFVYPLAGTHTHTHTHTVKENHTGDSPNYTFNHCSDLTKELVIITSIKLTASAELILTS